MLAPIYVSRRRANKKNQLCIFILFSGALAAYRRIRAPSNHVSLAVLFLFLLLLFKLGCLLEADVLQSSIQIEILIKLLSFVSCNQSLATILTIETQFDSPKIYDQPVAPFPLQHIKLLSLN